MVQSDDNVDHYFRKEIDNETACVEGCEKSGWCNYVTYYPKSNHCYGELIFDCFFPFDKCLFI